jgi:serine/threonine-protein kinase
MKTIQSHLMTLITSMTIAGYLLRRIRKSELSGYSPLFLDLLRNAIFARHGRKFVTPELQSYFNRQPWYSARYQPNKFPAKLLSSVEHVVA